MVKAGNTREPGMTLQPKAANGSERPHNNLLRRLSAGDFALLSPHLAHEESRSNDLLYNPGDDVDTVHFSTEHPEWVGGYAKIEYQCSG